MLNLITDRTRNHADYLEKLNHKSWNNMTSTERAEWSGDPEISPYLTEYPSPVNLFSGNYYSTTGTAEVKGDSVVLKPIPGISKQEFVRFSLGKAMNFESRTVTFSFESLKCVSGADPVFVFRYSEPTSNIAVLYSDQGTQITFECPFVGVSESVELYMFVYFVSSSLNTAADDEVITVNKPMFEFGPVAHKYVPYYPVLTTYARKGAYNCTDLNRVEKTVADLSVFFGMGLKTKTDWSLWDIPTSTEMSRYLNNIVAIRDAALGRDDTLEFPELPTNMARLTWETANNIEKTLYVAYGLKGGTLAWDGNLDGKVSVPGNPRYVKISDAVLTEEDVINGVSVWLHYNVLDTKVETTVEVVSDDCLVICPTEETYKTMEIASVNEAGARRHGLPSAGTYFAYYSSYRYVTKLVVPGYTGFLSPAILGTARLGEMELGKT